MSTKNKITLSIIIFLAAGTAFTLLLITPVYNNIQQNSQEMSLQKQELASLEEKINNIEDFRNNYPGIKKNLAIIDGLFIKSKAPISLISFLEKSSQDSQIPIEIFPSAAKQDKEDEWPSMIFRIESIGPFPNFTKLLEKIESSPYLLELQSLRISELTEAELKSTKYENAHLGDIKANFSLKIYSD